MGVDGNKNNYKIANLLSTIKKISFKASFFTFEGSLAFIKALILHDFDLKHYIWIQTNASSIP